MVDNTERVHRITGALERYNLKWSQGKTKARCDSPLRPGSNSHAFSITLKASAPGGGVYWDHVTNEGGDFLKLETLLPGFVAPSQTSADTKAKAGTITDYAGLRDYAQAQGIPEDVMRAAGWREGMFYCPATKRERKALLFDTETGTRARFIDGLKPKYMSPAGYRRSLYRFEEALHIAQSTGQPLTFCNGEASVLVAQYFGVAATAVTGGGENDIPSDLLNRIQASEVTKFNIALDSDTAGNAGSFRMAATLRSAGYEVRVLDLNGEKGFDLANFAKLHQLDTPTALQALNNLPEPQVAAPDASAELTHLRAENEHLRTIIAQQQQEIHQVKARQRWQNDLIKNPYMGAADKITVLVTYADLAHKKSKEPDDPPDLPVNYTTLAERAGQSPDTISRAVKKLEGVAWTSQKVKTQDQDTGAWRTTVRLTLLPALTESPQELQPTEQRKHGGYRKPRPAPSCAEHGEEAPVLEETTVIKQHLCGVCETTLDEPVFTQERKMVWDPNEDEAVEDVGTEPQVAALNSYIQSKSYTEPQVAARSHPSSPPPRDYAPGHVHEMTERLRQRKAALGGTS